MKKYYPDLYCKFKYLYYQFLTSIKKDIILKELKILNLSTVTQTTILDKSDIKIKIFISIKGK
jgi:hypothetical protein